MARFPTLLAAMAAVSVLGSLSAVALAEPRNGDPQPTPPSASPPPGTVQPSGVVNADLVQPAPNPQAVDFRQRKPPRIWLFMGFGG